MALLPAHLARTTTFRLVLTAAPLALLAGWAVLGFVYWATLDVMDRRTNAALEAELHDLVALHAAGGPGLLAVAVQERAEAFGGLRLYALQAPDGRLLAGDAPPGGLGAGGGEVAEDGARPRMRLRSRVVPGLAVDGAAVGGMAVEAGAGGLRLTVGRDLSEQAALATIVGESVAAALALTVLSALLTALVVSRAVLRRIDAINRAAQRIMAGGSDAGPAPARVPVRGSGDEFDQLAANLNRMLDRMDQAVESMRDASNDIAHSLRTPLTRLRSRLELLLLRLPAAGSAVGETVADPGNAETIAAVSEAIGHADELLGVFNALLRLARVENADPAALRTPVDLSAVAGDAAELYGALAEERGLAFSATVAPGLMVAGDRQLLFQVIANLLDNAIKYTPPGGWVGLGLEAAADGGAVLTVSDSGPGIAAADRARAVERFTRLPATAAAAPGVGLGLSLVAAAARVLGATLRLDDAACGRPAPGLRVSLRFTALEAGAAIPAARSSSPPHPPRI